MNIFVLTGLLAMLATAIACGWRGWALIRAEARTRRPAQRRYTLSSYRKRLWINHND